MKKTKITLCLLGVLAWMTACKPSEANAPQGAENTPVRDTVLTERIRFCESTYPYRDGLLVANFGTEALDPLNTQGKGYILYFEAGKVDTLLPPQGYLSAPKGMFIRGERFFVCDVNKVVEFRLDSLSLAPREIVLPAEDLFVNDLAAWGDTLYISVTNTGRIYRMDLSDPQASPVLWAQVPGANGMTFGQDGRPTGRRPRTMWCTVLPISRLPRLKNSSNRQGSTMGLRFRPTERRCMLLHGLLPGYLPTI